MALAVVVVIAMVVVTIGGRVGALHVLHVLGLAWVWNIDRRGREVGRKRNGK